MADGERVGELKAILDTFRVWTRVRRATPRVVEMNPFRGAPQAFTLRVATESSTGRIVGLRAR